MRVVIFEPPRIERRKRAGFPGACFAMRKPMQTTFTLNLKLPKFDNNALADAIESAAGRIRSGAILVPSERVTEHVFDADDLAVGRWSLEVRDERRSPYSAGLAWSGVERRSNEWQKKKKPYE